MIWLHLGRVLGIVGLLSGLIPLVVAIVRSELSMVLASVVGMAAGLGLAAVSDRALVARRMRQVQQAKRLGKEFFGDQLIVGMRWFRWGWMTITSVGLAVLAFWLSRLAWLEGKPIFVVFGLFGAAICLAVSWSLICLAVESVKNAGLLKLDRQGLRIAGGNVLGWHGIRGVGVAEEHVGRGDARRYCLRFAIDPEVGRDLSIRQGSSPWRWSQPSLTRGGTVVNFPMLLLAGDPHFIGESCRALGVRYGPRFLPSWYDNPYRNVVDFEREAEEFRRLDEILAIGGSLKPADLKRMSVAEQKRALVERMEAMDRLRSPPEEFRS